MKPQRLVLLRNVGVALCVNQYLNPIALEAIGWKYYLVVSLDLLWFLGYVTDHIESFMPLPFEQYVGILAQVQGHVV